MSDLLVELANVTESLEEKEIEYAVCGGLALTILGFPRATFDIDILIRPESLDRSFEIAKEFGFDIHGLDMSFRRSVIIGLSTCYSSSGRCVGIEEDDQLAR
jgi:hypothetical protein